jgi:hypothetical protein
MDGAHKVRASDHAAIYDRAPELADNRCDIFGRIQRAKTTVGITRAISKPSKAHNPSV